MRLPQNFCSSNAVNLSVPQEGRGWLRSELRLFSREHFKIGHDSVDRVQYVTFEYAEGRKAQRMQVQLQWTNVALSHAQIVQEISGAIAIRRRDRRQRFRMRSLELEGVRAQESQ
jgi:hypothetical protein